MSPPELTPGYDVDFDDIECDGRPRAPGFRARIYGGPPDLARGDRVEVIADLAPAQLFRDEGLGDPRPGAARRGVLASGGAHYVKILRAGWGPFAFVDHLRARARERIEATFVPEAAPMARALVLGESDLEEADNQAFRASGLAHLLAVSGTHLVLVVVGAVRALVALLTRFERVSSRWDVGRDRRGGGHRHIVDLRRFRGGLGVGQPRCGHALVCARCARPGASPRRPACARALALGSVTDRSAGGLRSVVSLVGRGDRRAHGVAAPDPRNS